jgi:cyanophycinase
MYALIGSGEYLPKMEAVDRTLIGRLNEPARVACLPTAAGTEGPERIAYWNDLGVQHFRALGAEVEAAPVIDASSANDPQLAARIRHANFVYLSGGKPDYLYHTLNGSLAWQAILAVLREGGILAGCSAGAMVMGARLPGFPRSSPAFGLLPEAIIIPHYDEVPEWVVRGLKIFVRGGLTVYGIPAYTALVVDQNHTEEPGRTEPSDVPYRSKRFEVVGSGAVAVWGKDGKRELHQE